MTARFSVWFTGLPGAGKSTLASALVDALERRGIRAELLDGDQLRRTISVDLGLSPSDRKEHGKRTIGLARAVASRDVVPVVALVSPYRETRAEARATLPRLAEVYVRCSPDVLGSRDPKGLYARSRAGTLTGLSGVDAPYEAPIVPEVVVDTDRASITSCVSEVVDALRSRGDL